MTEEHMRTEHIPQPTEQLETIRDGLWVFREIKKGVWKAFLADKVMTMTGTAVTVDLHIPFFHTFERIELTQNNAAGVANIDSFDFDFTKKTVSDPDISQHRVTIWSKTALLVSDYGVNFTKDSFEREPATYTISLTGTNTNLMYPVIYFIEGNY